MSWKKRRRKIHKGLPSSVIRKHNKKRRPSSIERLVASWLTIDKIPFRTEVKAGKCHIDVVIKTEDDKFAIELNGCHWHGCVKCNPKMPKEMQMKRFKDIKRYQFLRRKGYRIIVFWEHDLLDSPDTCRERLRRLWDSSQAQMI